MVAGGSGGGARIGSRQRRAAEEGFADDELALFDLLFKDSTGKAER